MNDPRKTLAQFQSALLDILHTETDATIAAKRIEKLYRTLKTQEVDHIVETRMADVAMQLTKKWAVPKSK